MKKAILVGGHSTPALALLQELQKRFWQIYYFGSKYTSLQNARLLSYEYRVLRERENVFFVPLPARGWPRSLSWQSFKAGWAFQQSFFKAFLAMLRLRPNVVVGFGGYLTPPVALAAALLRIPLILHEQTTTLGLGNRIALPWAKKVALSFPIIGEQLPSQKVVLTGNLLREETMIVKESLVSRTLLLYRNKPILYLTGGKTGSVALNNFLARELSNILPSYYVIHQAGELSYQHFLDLRRSLPNRWRQRYLVAATFPAADVGWILSKARLVIARSGANTVSELIWWRCRAILIPLPISIAGEQEKNARFLAGLGLGVLISQKQLANIHWSVLEQKVEQLKPRRKDIAKQRHLLATSRQKLAALVTKWGH